MMAYLKKQKVGPENRHDLEVQRHHKQMEDIAEAAHISKGKMNRSMLSRNELNLRFNLMNKLQKLKEQGYSSKTIKALFPDVTQLERGSSEWRRDCTSPLWPYQK